MKLILDSAINLEKYITTNKLVIYLYNSFQGKTLDLVLDILCQYDHLLIYIDPAEEFKINDYQYNIIYKKQGKYNADTWLIAQRNKDEH